MVDVIDDGVHEKHLEFDGGGVYQVNVILGLRGGLCF